MQQFIESLPACSLPAFVFNTYGMMNGKTLKLLSRWAGAKGFRVAHGFALHMPENYPSLIVGNMGNEQAPNPMELEQFHRFIDELDGLIGHFRQSGTIKTQPIKYGLASIFPAFPRTRARKGHG